jgi:hypothetical protein
MIRRSSQDPIRSITPSPPGPMPHGNKHGKAFGKNSASFESANASPCRLAMKGLLLSVTSVLLMLKFVRRWLSRGLESPHQYVLCRGIRSVYRTSEEDVCCSCSPSTLKVALQPRLPCMDGLDQCRLLN